MAENDLSHDTLPDGMPAIRMPANTTVEIPRPGGEKLSRALQILAGAILVVAVASTIFAASELSFSVRLLRGTADDEIAAELADSLQYGAKEEAPQLVAKVVEAAKNWAPSMLAALLLYLVLALGAAVCAGALFAGKAELRKWLIRAAALACAARIVLGYVEYARALDFVEESVKAISVLASRKAATLQGRNAGDRVARMVTSSSSALSREAGNSVLLWTSATAVFWLVSALGFRLSEPRSEAALFDDADKTKITG